MLIPFGRENPVRRTPIIIFGLIVINCFFFFAFESNTGEFIRIINSFGLRPSHPTGFTMITHMFLHGGLFHLFGNMFFLWIFGPNVEDLMGRIAYPVFYILCGLAAALLHMASVRGGAGADMPMVGASGAISGIMGAYFVLFPLSRLKVFLWLIPPIPVSMHAFWFLLIYILIQIKDQLTVGATSGVAVMAHIGGFAFGAGILYLLLITKFIVVPNYDRVKRGEYAEIPHDDIFFQRLASAYQTRRYGTVVPAYLEILSKAPGIVFDEETQLRTAWAVAAGGRPDLAISAYRRLMEVYPDSPAALRAAIEIARISAGHYRDSESAKAYLNWVITSSPQSPLASEAKEMMRHLWQ